MGDASQLFASSYSADDPFASFGQSEPSRPVAASTRPVNALQEQLQKRQQGQAGAPVYAAPAAAPVKPALTQEQINNMYYYMPEGLVRTGETDQYMAGLGYYWYEQYGCFVHHETYTTYMAQHEQTSSQYQQQPTYSAPAQTATQQSHPSYSAHDQYQQAQQPQQYAQQQYASYSAAPAGADTWAPNVQVSHYQGGQQVSAAQYAVSESTSGPLPSRSALGSVDSSRSSTPASRATSPDDGTREKKKKTKGTKSKRSSSRKANLELDHLANNDEDGSSPPTRRRPRSKHSRAASEDALDGSEEYLPVRHSRAYSEDSLRFDAAPAPNWQAKAAPPPYRPPRPPSEALSPRSSLSYSAQAEVYMHQQLQTPYLSLPPQPNIQRRPSDSAAPPNAPRTYANQVSSFAYGNQGSTPTFAGSNAAEPTPPPAKTAAMQQEAVPSTTPSSNGAASHAAADAPAPWDVSVPSTPADDAPAPWDVPASTQTTHAPWEAPAAPAQTAEAPAPWDAPAAPTNTAAPAHTTEAPAPWDAHAKTTEAPAPWDAPPTDTPAPWDAPSETAQVPADAPAPWDAPADAPAPWDAPAAPVTESHAVPEVTPLAIADPSPAGTPRPVDLEYADEVDGWDTPLDDILEVVPLKAPSSALLSPNDTYVSPSAYAYDVSHAFALSDVPSPVAPAPVAAETKEVPVKYEAPVAAVPKPAVVVPKPAVVVSQPATFVPQSAAVVLQSAAVVPQSAAIVPEPAAVPESLSDDALTESADGWDTDMNFLDTIDEQMRQEGLGLPSTLTEKVSALSISSPPADTNIAAPPQQTQAVSEPPRAPPQEIRAPVVAQPEPQPSASVPESLWSSGSASNDQWSTVYSQMSDEQPTFSAASSIEDPLSLPPVAPLDPSQLMEDVLNEDHAAPPAAAATDYFSGVHHDTAPALEVEDMDESFASPPAVVDVVQETDFEEAAFEETAFEESAPAVIPSEPAVLDVRQETLQTEAPHGGAFADAPIFTAGHDDEDPFSQIGGDQEVAEPAAEPVQAPAAAVEESETALFAPPRSSTPAFDGTASAQFNPAASTGSVYDWAEKSVAAEDDPFATIGVEQAAEADAALTAAYDDQVGGQQSYGETEKSNEYGASAQYDNSSWYGEQQQTATDDQQQQQYYQQYDQQYDQNQSYSEGYYTTEQPQEQQQEQPQEQQQEQQQQQDADYSSVQETYTAEEPAADASVVADESVAQQAIGNVISNGVEYAWDAAQGAYIAIRYVDQPDETQAQAQTEISTQADVSAVADQSTQLGGGVSALDESNLNVSTQPVYTFVHEGMQYSWNAELNTYVPDGYATESQEAAETQQESVTAAVDSSVAQETLDQSYQYAPTDTQYAPTETQYSPEQQYVPDQQYDQQQYDQQQYDQQQFVPQDQQYAPQQYDQSQYDQSQYGQQQYDQSQYGAGAYDAYQPYAQQQQQHAAMDDFNKSRRPHSIPVFAFGGRLILVNQHHGSAQPFKVHRVADLLAQTSTAGAISKWPGPLKKGTTSAVVTYLNEMVAQSQSAYGESDSEVMWRLIRSLYENGGFFNQNEKAEAALTLLLIAGQQNFGSFVNDAQRPAAPAADPAKALAQVRQLLLSGKRQDAVDAAAAAGNWSHALALATLLPAAAQRAVVGRFAAASLPEGDPLRTMLAALSLHQTTGGPAAYAQQLSSEQAKSEATSRWKETLGLLIQARDHSDIGMLMRLADLLNANGQYDAAHVCLLVADMPKPDLPRLVGAPLSRAGLAPGIDAHAFQRTELLEAARIGRNTQYSLPWLHVFRVRYAALLSELGHLQQAQRYVDLVTSSLQQQHAKGGEYFSRQFLHWVAEFSARLQMEQARTSTRASTPGLEAFANASNRLGGLFQSVTSRDGLRNLFDRGIEKLIGDDTDKAAESEVQQPFLPPSGRNSRTQTPTDFFPARTPSEPSLSRTVSQAGIGHRRMSSTQGGAPAPYQPAQPTYQPAQPAYQPAQAAQQSAYQPAQQSAYQPPAASYQPAAYQPAPAQPTSADAGKPPRPAPAPAPVKTTREEPDDADDLGFGNDAHKKKAPSTPTASPSKKESSGPASPSADNAGFLSRISGLFRRKTEVNLGSQLQLTFDKNLGRWVTSDGSPLVTEEDAPPPPPPKMPVMPPPAPAAAPAAPANGSMLPPGMGSAMGAMGGPVSAPGIPGGAMPPPAAMPAAGRRPARSKYVDIMNPAAQQQQQARPAAALPPAMSFMPPSSTMFVDSSTMPAPTVFAPAAPADNSGAGYSYYGSDDFTRDQQTNNEQMQMHNQQEEVPAAH